MGEIECIVFVVLYWDVYFLNVDSHKTQQRDLRIFVKILTQLRERKSLTLCHITVHGVYVPV